MKPREDHVGLGKFVTPTSAASTQSVSWEGLIPNDALSLLAKLLSEAIIDSWLIYIQSTWFCASYDANFESFTPII